MSRYSIAEWFGQPFRQLAPPQRQALAAVALGQAAALVCPFRQGDSLCSKKGGVCSIQSGRNNPVIVCPRRFEQEDIIPLWLAKIVGFQQVYVAREVPFMRSSTTGRAAGRIDLVIAENTAGSTWFGLEIQAVYFSGKRMEADFQLLLESNASAPPLPTAVRRPDWRSSSAKRLMPQIQIKGPTLRRWGTKLAVTVDFPFFNAIGGPSLNPSHDLNDGDIIWLVPRMDSGFCLRKHHWEVLSLEASGGKLLAADTVKRDKFETSLRKKLEKLGDLPVTKAGRTNSLPPQINPAAFAETERDPIPLSDMKAAMRQVMAHPDKSETKSENREPTTTELTQRWKMHRA